MFIFYKLLIEEKMSHFHVTNIENVKCIVLLIKLEVTRLFQIFPYYYMIMQEYVTKTSFHDNLAIIDISNGL